jgi:hypothetical protein
MSSKTNNWMGAMTRVFRADPKKTGSLAVLLLVLAVMVGRQVTSGRGGRPAAAAGAATGSRVDLAGSATVTPASRAGVAEAFQEWAQAPVLPVSRNLFAVRIEYFPLDGSRTTQSDVGQEGFWSSLEKSLTLRTDEKVRQENLIASFVKDAEKLQLQSTLPESRKAMINGQLVGEGSVVANFRVVKIEPRKVIVEREGITLAIQMK